MNWGNIATLGIRIASVLVPQISAVEALAKSIPALKGQAKEDAVVDLARNALQAAEGVTGKTLLDEPTVEVASRSFIQSYVALQNAIASAKALHETAPASSVPPAAQ